MVVPRARLADWLRAIVSVIAGVITMYFGRDQLWMLPLGLVLLGYAVSLGIKLADPRPALIADAKALTVFRFPGKSRVVPWDRLADVTYLKMRVKRVMFFKVVVQDGDQPTETAFEMPSTDFSGKGRDIVARINALRAQYS